MIKFIIYNFIGIFIFFTPIKLNNKITIPIDHIIIYINNHYINYICIYTLVLIALGVFYPFITKSWNKNRFNKIISFFNFSSIFVGVIFVADLDNFYFISKDMLSIIFNNITIPISIAIPIGSIFLTFLIDYGLLEFIGILMQPIMKPLFKVPGKSAINALASFLSNSSIGVFITDTIFKDSKYSIKEASIIVTGFSTVSISSMIIIAKTLDLMSMWNAYFITTLIVTCSVTSITARIPPLSRKSNSYISSNFVIEAKIYKNFIRNGWTEAIKSIHKPIDIYDSLYKNFKNGFIVTITVLPSIVSIGTTGLILSKYTCFIDLLAYIFYPVLKILQLPEPMLTAKSASLGIIDLFLPSLLITDSSFLTRFIIGVVSVSSVLSFCSCIPCILSTKIPLSVSELFLIWIERVVFSFIIVTPIVTLII
ncbi:YjiH family protein [Tepidibacter hydrothermalis]|uniref:YjiH family protein n=1 Tax=Tepidibacter hydrothermalis TaxID=3036126 RepID=A0ABY8EE79_9FIRM|nr:YjiH family protein [Tepidibacter hydrothermalis]WFD09889.1 YjiH family protein [Tepidibacter hydrothermalis]